MHTLIGVNYLHKMDNLDVLTKIVKQLPHHGISGWQDQVDYIIYHQREEVRIKNVAEYVPIKTRQL